MKTKIYIYIFFIDGTRMGDEDVGEDMKVS